MVRWTGLAPWEFFGGAPCLISPPGSAPGPAPAWCEHRSRHLARLPASARDPSKRHVMGTLCRTLGVSYQHLGVSCQYLGVSCQHLGVSCQHLGVSCQRFSVVNQGFRCEHRSRHLARLPASATCDLMRVRFDCVRASRCTIHQPGTE